MKEKEILVDQFDLCGCAGHEDLVRVVPLDEKDISMKNGLPFLMANQFIKRGNGKAIVCAVGR